ncbi:hypothetical protein MBLNU230_g2197t1 [Neophaeotheca triangularis]
MMDAFDRSVKPRAGGGPAASSTTNGQPAGSPMVKTTSNGSSDSSGGPSTRYMPTFGSMDPFYPNSSDSAGPKMNVSANVFKPSVIGASSGKPRPKPISLLNYGSVSDDQPLIVSSPTPIKTKGLAKVPASLPTPIGTMSPGYSPTEKQEAAEFTTDCARGGRWIGTHYVVVMNVDPADFQAAGSATAVEMLGFQDKVLEHKACTIGATNKLVWHMRFDDLNEVNEAMDMLQSVDSKWVVEVASQADFAQAIGATHNSPLVRQPSSMYEAQARLSATFTGLSKDAINIDTVALRKKVKEFANGFGKIVGFLMLDDAVHPFFEFRVEYTKITSVRKLVEACSPIPKVVEDFKVAATQWKATAYEQASSSPSAAALASNMNSLALTPSNRQQHMYGVTQTSPTARTQWVTDLDGNTTLLPPPRVLPVVNNSGGSPYTPPQRQMQQQLGAYQTYSPGRCMDPYSFSPDVGVSQYTPSRSGRPQRRDQQNQDVTIDKLELGLDTRTTLMLRNMPNNLKADGFKALLDAAVPGKYDFSYLRIDFAQDKNVGYGFVNFSRCDAIRDFVLYYQNRPWSSSSPRKFSDYSYATIQGLEGLIEKFRNSAIMDEFPQHRPKLWWTEDTVHGPEMLYLVGQERDMPPPNNLSKKQRSQDNAQQIGLFPPKSNTLSRDSRQFRGRFDRGTTPQQREEARFHQHSTPPAYGMPAYGAQGFSPLHMGPYAGGPYQANPYPQSAPGFLPQGMPGSPFMLEQGYQAPPVTPSSRYRGNGASAVSAPRSMVQIPGQHYPGSMPPQRSSSGVQHVSPTHGGNPFSTFVSSPLKENWDDMDFGRK